MTQDKLFITREIPIKITRIDGSLVIEECWDIFSLQLHHFKNNLNALWSGIVPFVPNSELEKRIVTKELTRLNYYPIFLDRDAWIKFDVFCDQTLNSISSYAPSQGNYNQELWQNYKEVQAEIVAQLKQYEILNSSLYLFGHELALLPGLLNCKIECGEINYFYFNSFPDQDIYSAFPWAYEFLSSMVQCDYLIFENYIDRINFHKWYEYNTIKIKNLKIEKAVISSFIEDIYVLPLTIDVNQTRNMLADLEVQKSMIRLRAQLNKLQIIFSYFENVQLRECLNVLKAIKLFFEIYPDKINQASYIIMLNCNLRSFSNSKNLIKMVENQVGSINALFGTLEWKPIHLYHADSNLQERYAYLRLSDVYLSFNTNNNWTGNQQEYIVAQKNQKGILVTFDYCNHKSMGTNPFNCNLNNYIKVANLLYTALEYPCTQSYYEMQSLYKNSPFNKSQNGILELENKKKYSLNSWSKLRFNYS